MAAAQSEAERIRIARLTFERAIADNVPMHEARDRVAHERWAESERRLAERRNGIAIPPAPQGEISDRIMMRN